MSATEERETVQETEEQGGAVGGRPEADRLSSVIDALMEDRRLREAQVAEERARRECEFDRLQTRREQEMQEKMDVVLRLLETVKGKDHTGESAVRVAKLTDADDIEGYLTTFERQMAAYDIDTSRWAFLLAPKLSGKAQQAYMAIDTAEAADYTAIKKAILKRYDVNEESYRRRLRARTRKPDESYANLATDIIDLGRKWLSECKDLTDALEKIGIEQLLAVLPEDVRVWVREHKPATCAEAGQWADEYAQARNAPLVIPKKSGPTRPSAAVNCHSCGQMGHIARYCPMQRSQGAGHSRPPHPMQQQYRDPRPPPQPQPNQSRPRVTRCFSCGQVGHIAMHCPAKALFCDEEPVLGGDVGGEVQEVVRNGTVEGTPVKMLLDTGSARTLVRRELVPEGKVLVGQVVAVRCAHGDNICYPLADVEVRVGGRQLTVGAGVSDWLPVPVLLGRDVPELFDLLPAKSTVSSELDSAIELVAMMTRSESRSIAESQIVQDLVESQVSDQAVDSVVGQDQVGDKEQVADPVIADDGIPGSDFDDSLFKEIRERRRLTRSQKRAERREYTHEPDATVESTENEALYMTKEEMAQQQAADETLHAAREVALGKKDTSAGGGFYYKDGLLYRRWVGNEKEGIVEQLVLPHGCRSAVMAIAHSVPLGGHLGKRKTTQRVMARFYWPTLYRDIAEFCRSCQACQLDSAKRSKKAPLIPLPIISEPFRRIAMDIVGPLPKSRSGKRFILVVCDYATRYPEAVPLRSTDAEHIAEELVQLFSRVGIPEEVLTDQGANFMSQLLAEVYKLLRVKPIRTSPYHPQTDGLVERFNQTLKAMLRKTAITEGKDWDKLLPYVLFAYREVPQASSGFSPFELLYGRTVRGPLDVLRESWEASTKSNENVVSYVLAMREKLDKMTELVHENLSKAQKYQKTWYDRAARVREFTAGDRVMVLLPTSTHKLRAQWQGPYTIVERVGQANYIVDMADKSKRRRNFHVNMLKEWHDQQETVLYTAADSDVDNDEDIPLWNDAVDAGPAISEHLSGEQRRALHNLIMEFQDVFNDKPGRTTLTEHKIETGSARPIRQQPYRLPHAYRETVQKDLREMEEAGIIVHSTSEWASPIVLVPKKDGTMRMCVDYRKLNSVSEADAYPMPRIDELIDRLGSANYISTLDLTRGYWQVPVAQESQPKTAFTTPFGLFNFTVMPFGLHGAPATFQRMMDTLLRGAED